MSEQWKEWLVPALVGRLLCFVLLTVMVTDAAFQKMPWEDWRWIMFPIIITPLWTLTNVCDYMLARPSTTETQESK